MGRRGEACLQVEQCRCVWDEQCRCVCDEQSRCVWDEKGRCVWDEQCRCAWLAYINHLFFSLVCLSLRQPGLPQSLITPRTRRMRGRQRVGSRGQL